MVVAMEQRNSTCHAFGPRYSTDKDGGRVNDRTGTQSQLGPGRASRETDLAVALLGFAFCRARQAALRSTRAILRSQVPPGAINGVIAAIGTIIVTSRPEVQLQAHFFGPSLGNGELVARSKPKGNGRPIRTRAPLANGRTVEGAAPTHQVFTSKVRKYAYVNPAGGSSQGRHYPAQII